MSANTPSEYQRLLVEQLTADGWSVEEPRPGELRIKRASTDTDEQAVGVNLSNLFQSGTTVERVADLVGKYLREAARHGTESDDAPLDRARLLPLIKHAGLIEEIAASRVQPIAWRPFITPDLIVALVLDFEESMRYVRQREAEREGLDFDDLLEVALANLQARSGGELYEMGDEQTGAIFVIATQDGYDATRILLKPLLENLAQRVQGRLVIGIPNRDFLIAFGDANPALVAQVRRQIEADSRTRPYPLTQTLFTLRDGELRVHSPGDPAAAARQN